MKVSVDTNLIIYAADSDSPHHEAARGFIDSLRSLEAGTVCLCGLVLLEVYMQLRNPAVFLKPYPVGEAVEFCRKLKSNPDWSYADYSGEIFDQVMDFEAGNDRGFRKVIDTRIALTLLHNGVTHFATANEKDFEVFDFESVWNPLEDDSPAGLNR